MILFFFFASVSIKKPLHIKQSTKSIPVISVIFNLRLELIKNKIYKLYSF